MHCNFTHFISKKFSNVRPLVSITFAQGFRISKIFGHLTSGSGGKKTFKWYIKSGQTLKQTNKQTHGQTLRLIESIGQEGRCFEKCDMWHVTCNIWHMTCYTWHVTRYMSHNFRSLGLMVFDLLYFEDLEKKDHWINLLISDKGVCRTDTAT